MSQDYKIGVIGKGHSGRSTLSAEIRRILAERETSDPIWRPEDVSNNDVIRYRVAEAMYTEHLKRLARICQMPEEKGHADHVMDMIIGCSRN